MPDSLTLFRLFARLVLLGLTLFSSSPVRRRDSLRCLMLTRPTGVYGIGRRDLLLALCARSLHVVGRGGCLADISLPGAPPRLDCAVRLLAGCSGTHTAHRTLSPRARSITGLVSGQIGRIAYSDRVW